MSTTWISQWAAIGCSLLLALIFSVYPLPFAWQWWRPEFVLLVVIFWVINYPLLISLVFICALGLFQDLLESVPFGQHSLGLIIVAYACLLFNQRVRNFPLWQQTLWVFVLVALAQLTDIWVQAIAGQPLSGPEFLLPALTSALCWPLCHWLLQHFCRYIGIGQH